MRAILLLSLAGCLPAQRSYYPTRPHVDHWTEHATSAGLAVAQERLGAYMKEVQALEVGLRCIQGSR